MCQANKGGWHSAEMMQNLTGLGVIPPAKRLNLNTDGFETFPRLLDLDLSAAMGKAKGNKVTEQNFHTCLNVANRTAPARFRIMKLEQIQVKTKGPGRDLRLLLEKFFRLLVG